MSSRKTDEDFVSPLDDDPIAETLYNSKPKKKAARDGDGRRRRPLPKGKSYRLVTFSFYEDDVARLDALLEEAKALGKRKVSRSQIVRLALRDVDLSRLPDEI